MKDYRQTSFYSIKGITKLIELGDQTYGEWIIYEGGLPTYHVNVFDQSFGSNVIINSLLVSKKETIESIINKINTKQATKLSLGNEPVIKIVKKSETVNLELGPLPELWIKNID